MRSRWLVAATGAYGLAIALIGVWTRPVDRDVPVTDLGPVQWLGGVLHLDALQSYQLVEVSANIVLFVPLGVLALLWRPRWAWGRAALAALAVSVGIEVVQSALLPHRFASVNDVIANTAGGAFGGLLVLSARTLRQ